MKTLGFRNVLACVKRGSGSIQIFVFKVDGFQAYFKPRRKHLCRELSCNFLKQKDKFQSQCFQGLKTGLPTVFTQVYSLSQAFKFHWIFTLHYLSLIQVCTLVMIFWHISNMKPDISSFSYWFKQSVIGKKMPKNKFLRESQ